MKIAFPHMGHLDIVVAFPHMGHLDIVVKSILENLGQEVIVPPPTSRKTLSLGVRHSPEFAGVGKRSGYSPYGWG